MRALLVACQPRRRGAIAKREDVDGSRVVCSVGSTDELVGAVDFETIEMTPGCPAP